MASTTLFSLPPEVIFLILDNMHPCEYSGFACTCQRALKLINQKLDTPEYLHYTTFISGARKSRTAAYIHVHRIYRVWQFPGAENGAKGLRICHFFNPEWNDPDL
jgi:hypothetical protein